MMRLRSTEHEDRDDAGMSMVEIMVTLGVMSVVMAVFAGSLIQVYRATVKTESISVVQAQLHTAFQRFDREIRYASWINQPGQVGSAWYVEWAGFDSATCYQLRLETAPAGAGSGSNEGAGVMQLLTWPASTSTPGNAQTIAANLTPPDGSGPFTVTIPTNGTGNGITGFDPDFQRLQIRVTGRMGDSSAQVDTTFTALNTSRNTPEKNECSKGRPA